MFVGHDWILSVSANGDFYSSSTKLRPARTRKPSGPHTCNLPHGVEDLQLLWVERWHIVVLVAVERGYGENTSRPTGVKEKGLPIDAGQQEVQTALNLGAVYEAVDVERVYGLSGWTPGPVTRWGTTDKKGGKKQTYI